MSDPFFQEVHTTFRNENLGMRLRKVNDLPVVQELVSTRFGFPGDAEKGGVPLCAVLVAINKEYTHVRGYDGTVSRIKGAGRPVTLGFRQLHAVEDVGAPRRFWQGFLRVKVAPHVWTGRFFVLREDGSLISYPSKDIESHSPVDRVGVAESTVVHGDLLKSFAGRLLADDATAGGNDALWSQAFAILLEDQLMFYRAESADAKLDWICALAVLFSVHQLGLAGGSGGSSGSSPPAASNSSRRLNRSPSAPRDAHAQSGTPAPLSPPDDKRQDRRLSPGEAAAGAGGSSGAAAAAASGGGMLAAGRTVAVGSRKVAPANRLKQGYLWKRGGSKLWEESRVNMAKSAIGLQAWNQRWFVLQDDGRLLWHRALPADASEVPNGQLGLQSVHVSADEADMAPYLREDELRGGGNFPFVLRTGMRLLFLRARSEQERSEWVSAIAAVADPHGQALFPHLAENMRDSRRRTLQRLTEQPELIFQSPETAYGLIVADRAAGDGGGAVRRDEFVTVAGQHFIPLCDAYTADLVFDALCRGNVAGPETGGNALESSAGQAAASSGGGSMSIVSCSSSGAGGGVMAGIGGGGGGGSSSGGGGFGGVAGLDYLSELLSEVTGGDDTRTKTVRAEPLMGGARLTFDAFGKYVRALQAQVSGPESWDELRQRLALDPFEVLVRWEEGVAERSQMVPGMGIADAGTLFLTDRHLFLHLSLRNQVRVVPLSSVREVREVSSRAGLMTWHDAVELAGCKVHTVLFTAASSSVPPDETAKERAKAQVMDYRLMFNKVKDLLSKPTNLQFSRRKAWLEVVREMTEAHKLSAALTRGLEVAAATESLTLQAEAEAAISPAYDAIAAASDGEQSASATPTSATEPAAPSASDGSNPATAAAAAAVTPPSGESFPLSASAAPSAVVALAAEGVSRPKASRAGALGRLRAKIKLLTREEEAGAGADAYQVQQDRLHLWVAANMVRARAIQRATNAASAPRSLFFCSTPHSARSRAVLREFLMEEDDKSHNHPTGAAITTALGGTATSGKSAAASAAVSATNAAGSSASNAGRARAQSVVTMGAAGATAAAAAVAAATVAATSTFASNNTAESNAAAQSPPNSGTTTTTAASDAESSASSGHKARAASASLAPKAKDSSQVTASAEAAAAPRTPPRAPLTRGASVLAPPQASQASAVAGAVSAAAAAGAGSGSGGGGGSAGRQYHMAYRRWLFVLVTCMARTGDYRKRRQQATLAFTPNKFRSEWECFWDVVDPVIDSIEDTARYLVRWESPLLSFCVMWALLAIAYHDLVGYVIPMCIFGNVVFISVRGAAAAAAARPKAAALTRQQQQQQQQERSSKQRRLTAASAAAPEKEKEGANVVGIGSALGSSATGGSNSNPGSAGPSPKPGVMRGLSGMLGGGGGGGGGGSSHVVAPPKEASGDAASGGSASASGGVGTSILEMPAQAVSWLTKRRAAGGGGGGDAANDGPPAAGADAAAGVDAASASAASAPASLADSVPALGFSDSEDERSGENEEEESDKMMTSTFLRGGDASGALLEESAEGAEWEEGGGGGEGEDLDGGEAPKQVQQQESLFKRMKLMQEKAGRMQAKLHMYNTVLLKITSLHCWTDRARTQIWLCLMTFVAVVLATVPARYLWAAAVLFFFTAPIRSPEKTLPELLWDDFWRGLPVESNTHVNLQMAAIYSSTKKEKTN